MADHDAPFREIGRGTVSFDALANELNSSLTERRTKSDLNH